MSAGGAVGGNAVDAIIATTIAVNTLAPYHSDLGGGGFAVIRCSDGTHEGLNFRHQAPGRVTMKHFQDGASTAVGGMAVAVPGQMKGLWALHQKHGKLSWRALLQPSITLARGGFEVTGDLREFTLRECLPGTDEMAGTWYETDATFHPLFQSGRALPIGAKYKRPELAETLEVLADQGVEPFYSGEIAKGIIQAVQARGGMMELEDLKNYQAHWCEPITGNYNGFQLWTVPAPASGAIWLAAMGILDRLELANANTAEAAHQISEVLRLAYGLRTQLGDPGFNPGLQFAQQSWLTDEALTKRAATFDPDHTKNPEFYDPQRVEIVNDAGTSNITVVDKDGMVVSITTTVGLNWGSHIMVPGYGFILNDSMDDFSVEGRSNATGYVPQKANFVEPRKRPLSSSCPYIVEDAMGRVVAAGGSAGGSTIISANTQVARNLLGYGMSASGALAACRLHDQLLPNVVELERSNGKSGRVEGFSEKCADALISKGHAVKWVATNRSTPCAIKLTPNGVWEIAGDPRKYDSGGEVVR